MRLQPLLVVALLAPFASAQGPDRAQRPTGASVIGVVFDSIVPSGGSIVLVASRGADTTDRIEVQVPPKGFLRHELYLGGMRPVLPDTEPVLPDTARVDSLVPAPRRRRTGDGRGSGIVVAASSGQPLATMRAVLDTVKVTANRLSERNLRGFRERQRTTPGHFLTPDDIARRGPLETSDLFRSVSGMHVDHSRFDASGFLMRGAYGWCSPGVYLNDSYMRDLAAVDIDDFVHPHEVAGIEIYSDATAPAPYQRMDGCGSVVIWTKGGQRTKETEP